MKHGFLKGLVTGIAVTLVVSFGVRMASYFVGDIFQISGRNEEAVGGEVSFKDMVTDVEFVKKCDVLNNYINEYYLNRDEISEKDINRGMFRGVMDSLGDKYAAYYDSDEYNSFMEGAKGQYGGIGTYVTQNISTGEIVIVNPSEGAPADKAGIKSGDLLVEVDGKSVQGLELDDIVAMMKGEEGTPVTLGVERDGNKLSIEVIREMVNVPTVLYEVLKDSNVGYIQVLSFESVTCNQFEEAVNAMESANVDGIIIDLRNNGGGLVDSVVKMLDRILPEGLVMYTETNKGRDEEYFSTAEQSYSKPYAVLINQYSASASEVFAGAVQDFGYGTLVGTKSYGKGVVQSIIPLQGVNDGSAIKLTTAKYFTPKGRNIDGIGIEPDVVVEYAENSVVEGDNISIDNQMQRAIEVIKEKTGK